MRPRRLLAAAAIAALPAFFCATAHAVLSISEPWVRPAADGRSAAVFMKLASSDEAALVGVDSFAARTAAIRAPGRSRPLPELPLPAGVPVEMKPDGVRIDLGGLVRRLKFGEHVPVTLILRSSTGLQQKLYVNAEVRRHSPTDDELNPHSHGHSPK